MRKIEFEEPNKKKKSLRKFLKVSSVIFYISITLLVLNNRYNYNKLIKENNIVFTKVINDVYNPSELIEANVIVSTKKGSGSGSIIRVEKKSTYILTAAHVVSDRKIERGVDGKLERNLVPSRNITVISKKVKAKALIMKIDYDLDVAVIKIFKKINVKPVVIAKEEPELGETVWSLSNPGGYSDIINKGIFSGISEEEDQSFVSIGGFFGSSGGMCLNDKGEQIGVISTVLIATIGRHFPSLTVYNGITRTADLNEFLEDVLRK